MNLWLNCLKLVLGHNGFQKLVRRRAYSFADKQIKALNHTEISSDVLAREAENCVWSQESINFNFSIGYWECWSYLGENDATCGICRASNFKNHGYNRGWFNQIITIEENGWHNSDLEEEATIMQKHYWDKISSGNSNDYYSASNSNLNVAHKVRTRGF